MKFEFEKLEFGKGSLAELIAYDRYVITTRDFTNAKVGDSIIYIKDVAKNTQAVGTITDISESRESIVVDNNDGSGTMLIPTNISRLVLETKPVQMWHRWAKGAASVETPDKLEEVEKDFAWLLDGYRYVLGGRIQAMLGHEFAGLGLGKSKLSAYNCLVLPSPKCSREKAPLENWLEIIHVAKREANSMAYGCGVGLNISTVPDYIKGPLTQPTVGYILGSRHEESTTIESDTFPNIVEFDDWDNTEDYELIIVEDSRQGIFDALMQMVEIIYHGYKVTIDFSELRPKGAYVKGIDGVSSGAISWMKLFDFVVGLLRKDYADTIDIAELYAFIPHLISQGGQRRGALMEVLNDDHPKIVDFIRAKRVDGRITGANLSVNLTDAFMAAVQDNEPVAVKIFDSIAVFAHASAEPGVLFMDRAQADSNTSYYQVIDAVNPCAEEPLPPNGVCNLGHLNLPMFLMRDRDGKWMMNYAQLAKAVKIAVRFQDNIVDYSSYFDVDIEEVQRGDRRIGIGTMGLATVLIRLGIRYGSDEAMEFAEELNDFIAEHAYQASVNLGYEKGSFHNYDPQGISEDSFLYRLFEGKIPGKLRNAALLTQAPTGSTGTMVDNLPGYNCSTGIEPYFAFKYYRASRLGLNEQEVELVAEYREEHPGKDLPGYFISADEITYREHVEMQGAIQKYVDAAISKTINLPEDATVADVKNAYLLAYEVGCKGVTVYRDGSRKGQVLAKDKDKAKLEDVVLSTYAKKDAEFTVKMQEVFAAVPAQKPFKKRARILYGKTVKQNSPFGKMYVTINSKDGIKIEEVFIHLGKVGSDIRAIVDSLGILLTLALSDRLSALSQEEKLIWLTAKLIGIKGANPIGFGQNRVDSLPDALGRVLKEYMTEDFALPEEVEEVAPEQDVSKYQKADRRDICPECGEATLVRIEGCEKCLNHGCGASKCS